MICFPNAKINIGLYITEKRLDGYHNLETLFYPLQLKDGLEIIENKGSKEPFVWSSSGIRIDGSPEDNLCIKALMLLKQDFDIPPVKMHLHKVIPFGAGLGGGSADAAFTIKMLNEMFSLNISIDQQLKYASQIGADCAFFIQNTPHTAKGIGDILISNSTDLTGFYLLLVKPEIHISTPEAYSGVVPKVLQVSIEEKLKSPVENWKDELQNDFEDSVFPNHPFIKEIKEEMYENEAIYASMTGSGAAVFGLFREEPDLEFKDCFIWKEKI